MSSKLITIGSALLAGTLAAIGGTAQADNINTSGTICQSFLGSQTVAIDHLANGVRNVNAAPRRVTCSIPRSPLPAAVAPRFRVAGHNNVNSCTACTLTLYRPNGVTAATQSFMQCAPVPAATNWNRLVLFPLGLNFDYASLLCTLPGNGAGLLFGVTAIQP